MPSQEDYLDRLLNGVSDDEENAVMEEAGAAAETDTAGEVGAAETDVTGDTGAAEEMVIEPSVQDAEASADIGAELFDGLDVDALGSLDLDGLDMGLSNALGAEIPAGLVETAAEEGSDAVGAEDLEAVAEGLDAASMAELDDLIAAGNDLADADLGLEGLDSAALEGIEGLGIEGIDDGLDIEELDDLGIGELDNLGIEGLTDAIGETSSPIDMEAADGVDMSALEDVAMGSLDDLDMSALDGVGMSILEGDDMGVADGDVTEVLEMPDVDIPENLADLAVDDIAAESVMPEDLTVADIDAESVMPENVAVEDIAAESVMSGEAAADNAELSESLDLEGLDIEGLDSADIGDLDQLDMEALDNLGVEDLAGADIELPEGFDAVALDGLGVEETAEPMAEEQTGAGAEPSESLDVASVDAVEEAEDEDTGMTEEEIEKLLEESSRVEESESAQAEDSADQDNLMELLQDAGDDDLQDIHDLLEKADNNEAVDEAVIAQMQGDGDGQALEGDMATDAEEAGLDARQQKAADKKKQREEKAAAKKAAKEAKKAEKLAKKAAKKAGKGAVADAAEGAEAAVGAGAAAAAGLAAQGAAEGGQAADAGAQETNEEDLGFDMSELDDLLNFSTDPNPEKPPQTDSAEEAGEAGVEAIAGAGDALAEITAEADSKEPEKKKGLLARILEFLTEEDEEDEEEAGKGTEDVPMSDENKNILKEMDQEGGKKAKKEKKPKKDKKGKKGADAEGAEGEGAEGEEGKKKKPKKEKKPKEQVPVDPKNKITVKKIMPVALASLSILLMIFLLVYLGGDFMLKRDARKAFYAEDYGTCYQELYGKKLNASEQVMFGKSASILRVRLWMREYELFAEEGAETQALDILIQSVNDYADLYSFASQWNADGEVSAVYAQMLEILQSKYGLTEAQALEIAAEPDDVQYTLMVIDVVEGKGMDAEVFEPVNLPDMLPEERLFPENNGGR
ncbi:MAG: hypothetical protein NC413_10705 [Muribaculum sp.]|nr:hypothetical protein [Muribaculum sp.]